MLHFPLWECQLKQITNVSIVLCYNLSKIYILQAPILFEFYYWADFLGFIKQKISWKVIVFIKKN